MDNYPKNNRREILTNLLLLIVLLLLLLIPGYLCYKSIFLNDYPTNKEDELNNKEEKQFQETEVFQPIQQDIEPKANIQYQELLPIIEGQQAYILVPEFVNKDDPPTLIVYNHGSTEFVTKDFEDPFMQYLRKYKEYLNKDNYIFGASNQHDANWGNQASIRDISNLIDWISNRYDIKKEVYMLGYSMGALSTLNYATQYPEKVSKISLLAPTLRQDEWNQNRAIKLRDINIKIWHGDKDSNIPLDNSNDFIDFMNTYGILIDLEVLENKDHFGLHTEYTEDLLNFFKAY